MGQRIALGLVETRGFAGMVHATDVMNKAADIELVRQFYIGGSYAIVIVRGDVAAVRTAVEAARTDLPRYCKVVATHFIDAIDLSILERLLTPDALPVETPPNASVGVVETVGVAGALEAAKRGLDVAEVILSSFEAPGGGLMATCFWGQVSDVRAAVDAACQHCDCVTRVNGSTIIPSPHPELPMAFSRNSMDGLNIGSDALGVIETLGFVALFGATDEALDTAEIAAGRWQTTGSSYNSIAYCGEVAAVREALTTAEAVARKKDRFIDSVLIPSPHAATNAILSA